MNLQQQTNDDEINLNNLFSGDLLSYEDDQSEGEMKEIEDMMSDWFSSANMDILPTSEGGDGSILIEESFNKRSAQQKNETTSIDEEDYPDGPERLAFELIKKNARNAYVKNIKNKPRFKAIEWLFIPNEGEISFDDCCQALGVRANLLRLRLMYQFYKSWLIFPQPLPFMAQGLPEIMCGRILYDEGDDGLFLAKRIWEWPSISFENLRQISIDYKIAKWEVVLQRMHKDGLIANKADNWYFTGKNPSELSTVKRKQFNWTKVSI